MIEIELAWSKIRDCIKTLPAESVGLGDSVGRVLAEPVTSGIDSPPFGKSIVDGFAFAEIPTPNQPFPITQFIPAGKTPEQNLESGQAAQIMTGAPVPSGTVCVVMVEKCTILQNDDETDTVQINDDPVTTGQNILPQGSVVAAGSTLAQKSHQIRAADVGTFAEFGYHQLRVRRKATVSVLATGDELVDVDQTPIGGQIRNSNGILLEKLADSVQTNVQQLGIARDNRVDLMQKIETGLKTDVLVLAGGVSAGVLDLVPSCLNELGVETKFHKINLKPGKPLWFGTSSTGTLVFGLPGNPISSLVCFRLFVKSAIDFMQGSSENKPPEFGDFIKRAPLSHARKTRAGRRTFWPARWVSIESQPHLELCDWKGSADQVTFLSADVLVDLGSQDGTIPAGAPVGYVSLY